ncbi:hypothetical protein NEOLEDRAFT_1070416 [Neolentinus lepideus HHB14362 ss-1]|uniref:Fatty acid desaturase domain-containing protein n=1 Tax=Neolentinus lepideus HHB14362 ss-1 TaxID=1314782 RepID=A0A165QV44_9AGAM|nr:hypothetical protein NEOLEDRAFT_1070416 [Neolentinus lepideus HHB14362 ss-1]
MQWYQIFQDGPEYEARKQKTAFTPTNLSLKDVHAAVPKHLFQRNTAKSMYYVLRHVTLTYAFYVLGTRIDGFIWTLGKTHAMSYVATVLLRSALWATYWFWQSIAFAGLWCLGEQTGHNALSPYPLFNAVVGIILHTFILVPYYSWRVTHRAHHKSTNNLERDETYIPPTRKDLKLPDGKVAVKMDYKEIIEETPAYTLFKLVMRQLLGYQLYILHNRKGNPKYPPWTSHYKPSSQIFKPEHRQSIIVSDVCIATMLVVLCIWTLKTGGLFVWKHYWVPIVTFTYLQHSDPTIPYYRRDQWTFARGALATVDRPFFGWIGRFFLHNIAHDHVAHHFFSMIPFYNQPKVTEAIKPVLRDHYNYDSTGIFFALWRSFRQCTFIEDDGDVVFFKNQQGEAVREVLGSAGVARAH